MSTQGHAGESQDFGILLNAAFGAFKQQLHEHMAQAGYADLGPSFGYVFRLLLDQPASLREVAELLGMTPQGALKIVDDMVDKGYVERRADDSDGRIKRLALTRRGRSAVGAARAFHLQFEQALAARLGDRRAQACRAALEDIVATSGGPARFPVRPV